jgi:hypothetical protein
MAFVISKTPFTYALLKGTKRWTQESIHNKEYNLAQKEQTWDLSP